MRVSKRRISKLSVKMNNCVIEYKTMRNNSKKWKSAYNSNKIK